MVLARNQSIPRIKSIPSSRVKTSVVKGTTQSFTTALQSHVNTSPAFGIKVPLADFILTGTFHFLHGISFFSTKSQSKTEHVAPVSAIMRKEYWLIFQKNPYKQLAHRK